MTGGIPSTTIGAGDWDLRTAASVWELRHTGPLGGNMHRQTARDITQSRGFTLLEVLLALLVLSIGLLGLAALQTAGLRAGRVASMHTLASRLAYDITERMRVNAPGVAADEYVIARTAPAPHTEPPTRAGQDLLDWRNAITQLPDGRSEITQCTPETLPACPAVDGRITHVVTLYWNESGASSPATFHCPPESDADFRCFRLITR
jgi:type IV pilus assembly protein PilV